MTALAPLSIDAVAQSIADSFAKQAARRWHFEIETGLDDVTIDGIFDLRAVAAAAVVEALNAREPQ